VQPDSGEIIGRDLRQDTYDWTLRKIYNSKCAFTLAPLNTGFVANVLQGKAFNRLDIEPYLVYLPFAFTNWVQIGADTPPQSEIVSADKKGSSYNLQSVLDTFNDPKKFTILDLNTTQHYLSLIVRDHSLKKDLLKTVILKNGKVETNLDLNYAATLRFFTSKNWTKNYANVIIKSLQSPLKISRVQLETSNTSLVYLQNFANQKAADIVHEKINFGDELDNIHIVYNESVVFDKSPLLFLLDDNLENQYNVNNYLELLKRGFILCYYNAEINYKSDLQGECEKLLAGLRYLKAKNIGDGYYLYSSGRYSGLIGMYLLRAGLFKYSIIKNPIMDLVHYFE
jgi:hypothetical protein